MTVKKHIGRLLWVVVGLLPASARAQNGIDPGAQPDPAVDCHLACEIAFREAIQPCISADGTIDEACAAGAKQAHEACIQACPPVEP
ncbi:hypothetical protein, partial [Enterococcus casseliflavus]|uniref:hypothetical protein n=1 Tax=Enterococcus casseliflavus TaxID=37734 RepID=UPI003D107B43